MADHADWQVEVAHLTPAGSLVPEKGTAKNAALVKSFRGEPHDRDEGGTGTGAGMAVVTADPIRSTHDGDSST
ncbi:hypothetical protein GCM10027074_75490 [Streptomyces deserti]